MHKLAVIEAGASGISVGGAASAVVIVTGAVIACCLVFDIAVRVVVGILGGLCLQLC